MNFTEPVFLPFLAVAVLGVSLLRAPQRRNGWLLALSLLFYGWHEPRFVPLLLFVALVDFFVPLRMAADPSRARAWLLVSLLCNLGVLGAFKYLDFFLSILAPERPPVGLPLPPGISFYTFQSMSYTIDVYRGRTAPRRSLIDYLAYVCMFPQLVAGPVERARDLLPQLEAPTRLGREDLAQGLSLCLRGAVKKIVVADTLSLYVDQVFQRESQPGPLLAAATLAFGVQILADFAGYTDIARGAARMMGFRLRVNFKGPYAARSPSDFWRRWHISFSSWIHEYLYVSLGGSRRGWRRTVLATVVAMLLSGLWHGAAWNFVLWGAWHAALLLLWRGGRALLGEGTRAALGFLGWPLTQLGVFIGWYLFRVPALPDLEALRAMAAWGSAADLADALRLLSLSGGMGLLLVGLHRARGLALALRPLAWAGSALLVLLFARDTASDFLYFRF